MTPISPSLHQLTPVLGPALSWWSALSHFQHLSPHQPLLLLLGAHPRTRISQASKSGSDTEHPKSVSWHSSRCKGGTAPKTQPCLKTYTQCASWCFWLSAFLLHLLLAATNGEAKLPCSPCRWLEEMASLKRLVAAALLQLLTCLLVSCQWEGRVGIKWIAEEIAGNYVS